MKNDARPAAVDGPTHGVADEGRTNQLVEGVGFRPWRTGAAPSRSESRIRAAFRDESDFGVAQFDEVVGLQTLLFDRLAVELGAEAAAGVDKQDRIAGDFQAAVNA